MPSDGFKNNDNNNDDGDSQPPSRNNKKTSGSKRKNNDDEDDDKKAAKRSANRESAYRCRQRSKILIEQLREQISDIYKQNEELRQSNVELDEKVSNLVAENQRLSQKRPATNNSMPGERNGGSLVGHERNSFALDRNSTPNNATSASLSGQFDGSSTTAYTNGNPTNHSAGSATTMGNSANGIAIPMTHTSQDQSGALGQVGTVPGSSNLLNGFANQMLQLQSSQHEHQHQQPQHPQPPQPSQPHHYQLLMQQQQQQLQQQQQQQLQMQLQLLRQHQHQPQPHQSQQHQSQQQQPQHQNPQQQPSQPQLQQQQQQQQINPQLLLLQSLQQMLSGNNQNDPTWHPNNGS